MMQQPNKIQKKNQLFKNYPMGSHLFLLFVFMLLLPAGKSDLAADKAALLVFSFAVRGRTLRWNQTHPTPCLWEGVKCDANHVIALRLPGDGLSGQIPSNSIGNLTHLRTLSLRRNALAGHLPLDLASCTELRYLFLQDNRFSGGIPEVLFGLNNLIRLNLVGNNFSGEVSPEFNNLTRLKTLYLESNQLSGSITELNIPGLEQFNVTSNRLNGSIPSSLRKMPSEAFQGNSLCGVPLNSCPNSGNKLAAGAISGIVIGSVMILLVLLILHRKMISGKTKPVAMSPVKPLEFKLPSGKWVIVSGHGGLGNGYSAATAKVGNAIDKSVNNGLVFFGRRVRAFDLEELLKASAEVLGKGTLWTTYMAVLEGWSDVTVKRLKDVSVSEREFREKVYKSPKTTLLEKLKALYSKLEGLPPERIVPTVGLNIGRIEASKTKLVFWDLGGQSGLRTIWEKYYEEAHAIIYVIDAACLSRFEDSKSALEKVLRHEDLKGAPLLILANKQDLPEAVSADELARYLDLKELDERLYMFEAISAFDGMGIKDGIEWLVEVMERSKRAEMLRVRAGAATPFSA